MEKFGKHTSSILTRTTAGVKIGQRGRFSKVDLMKIAKLYDCELMQAEQG